MPDKRLEGNHHSERDMRSRGELHLNADKVTLDGVTYHISDLSENGQRMVKHLFDLERKLSSMRFNLEQIEIGREAFVTLLRSEVGK